MKNLKKGLLGFGFATLSFLKGGDALASNTPRPSDMKITDGVACLYDDEGRAMGLNLDTMNGSFSEEFQFYDLESKPGAQTCGSSNINRFEVLPFSEKVNGKLVAGIIYPSTYDRSQCLAFSAWQPLPFGTSNCQVVKEATISQILGLVPKPEPAEQKPLPDTNITLEIGNITDKTVYSDTRLRVHLDVEQGKQKIEKAFFIVKERTTGTHEIYSIDPNKINYVDIPENKFNHYSYLSMAVVVEYDDGGTQTVEVQTNDLMYSKFPSDYTGDSLEIIAPWNPKSWYGYSLVAIDLATGDVLACAGSPKSFMQRELENTQETQIKGCVQTALTFVTSGKTPSASFFNKGEKIYKLIDISNMTLIEKEGLFAYD